MLASVRVLPAGSNASVAPHGIDCRVGSSNDGVGDGRLGITDEPSSERLGRGEEAEDLRSLRAGTEVCFGGLLKSLLLGNLLVRARVGPVRVALARFCPKDAAL